MQTDPRKFDCSDTHKPLSALLSVYKNLDMQTDPRSFDAMTLNDPKCLDRAVQNSKCLKYIDARRWRYAKSYNVRKCGEFHFER